MRLRVGFTSSKTWVSKVIQFFTGDVVSHAFVLVEGGEVGDVIDAAWCGFRINTTDKIGAGIVEVLDTQVPMRLDLAKQWLGTPYAYEALLGMAWVCFGRMLRHAWRNPMPNPHHMFCSEAIVYLMQASGEPGAEALDPLRTSPADLRRWMKTRSAAA